MRRKSFPLIGLLLLLSVFALIPKELVSAQDSRAQTKTYRLVRVTIPADSLCRKRDDINKPPNSYVEIQKNGERIGELSSSAVGWESEFPDTSENRWEIELDQKASYVVKLLDSQWTADAIIFSRAGLKAASFESPITEDLGKNNSPDNAISVEFEEVIGEQVD